MGEFRLRAGDSLAITIQYKNSKSLYGAASVLFDETPSALPVAIYSQQVDCEMRSILNTRHVSISVQLEIYIAILMMFIIHFMQKIYQN